MRRGTISMSMAKVNIALTVEQLQTLIMLADNQLFRVKFIDSKIPGNVRNPQAIREAQAVIQILQDAFNKEKGFTAKDEFVLKGNSASRA
jgi:hypothetical protein